jgi:hypothetical protein
MEYLRPIMNVQYLPLKQRKGRWRMKPLTYVVEARQNQADEGAGSSGLACGLSWDQYCQLQKF